MNDRKAVLAARTFLGHVSRGEWEEAIARTQMSWSHEHTAAKRDPVLVLEAMFEPWGEFDIRVNGRARTLSGPAGTSRVMMDVPILVDSNVFGLRSGKARIVCEKQPYVPREERRGGRWGVNPSSVFLSVLGEMRASNGPTG